MNGNKLGKGNRILLSSGFEITLVLNKKKMQGNFPHLILLSSINADGTDRVAYIFQSCAEEKPHEEVSLVDLQYKKQF